MRGAGSIVQAVGNGVQFSLGVHRQIGALGQVLPQQPVGVLAGTALPGAVGVAEVHLDARARGELTVARHLLALVAGQAVAHRLGNRIQLGRRARLDSPRPAQRLCQKARNRHALLRLKLPGQED